MVQLFRVLGTGARLKEVLEVDLAELLPQSGCMRLLDTLVLHEGDRTVCRIDPLRSGLFEEASGRLPTWLALEYMAQCASVHGALALDGPRAGAAPRVGLLLGARQLELRVPRLPVAPMEVEARHHGDARGLVSFDCSLRDPGAGDLLATGRLNVYTLSADALPGE